MDRLNCGALLEGEIELAVVAAGFVDFAINWRGDVFSGAPQSSSAAAFGTLGITFGARKPATERRTFCERSVCIGV